MVGYLVLENGEIFEGERIGYNIDTACEVVFNTGMVGYIETFTDPSYAGQGIVMTYPLIGNYGVIPEDYESDDIWAKAVFIHELAEFESNFRTKFNLDKFLRDYKVPGLTNINTRKLTKILRDAGTMKGYVTSNISNIDDIMEKIKNYEVGNVVEKVTSKEVKVYGKGKSIRIALMDYGFKHNIVNSLLKRGAEVTVFPADTTAEKVIAIKPDGIIASDGGVIDALKEYAPDIDIHISTQANVISYHTSKFWYDNGAKRVILGREMNKEQIKELIKKSSSERFERR